MDINTLRQYSVAPHYFDLGFIQLKVNDTDRFHFWHEDFATNKDLHDHRYDFTSMVIRGKITNELFSFTAGTGKYYKHSVSCNKLIQVYDDPVSGDITKIATFSTEQGDCYSITSNVLHRAVPSKNAVTKLTRQPTIHQYANVITNSQLSPPCLFTTPYTDSQMWEMIEYCLNYNIGYHIDKIPKGMIGESSKILEEVLELIDAERQSEIMASVELSDIYGALCLYAESHNMSMHEIITMSTITRRAFVNGYR